MRSNIFINANLTPAEAKAAYEMRCHRREAQKSKTVLGFRRSKSLSQSQSQSADILSPGSLSAEIGSQSTSRLNTTTANNKKDGYRQLNVHQLGSLRPWDHRGKCYMDRKRIQCLSNASQHVSSIYLQPFSCNSSRKIKSSPF